MPSDDQNSLYSLLTRNDPPFITQYNYNYFFVDVAYLTRITHLVP